MPVLPKVIPGRLHPDNRGSIDWGYGLVAYGCHSYVVVVAPSSLEVVQTLDEHMATVSCVKWSKMSHGGLLAGHEPVLASGDRSGTIIIWNVNEASVVNTLKTPKEQKSQAYFSHDEPAGVDQLEWHPENTEMLVSIHRVSGQQQASLILWNAREGSQVWRCALPDVQYTLSLVFSPFDPSLLAFASHPGTIAFVTDFNLRTAPTKVDQRYKVAVSKDTKKQKEEKGPDFLQLLFSPHTYNLVYVLSARDISILDTTLHKPVGMVVLDQTKEDFQSMLLCHDHPDILYCLHVDGSLSVWNRKPGLYDYELGCWTDVMQFSKKSQKKSSAISCFINGTVQQKRLTAVGLDGAIWVWDYSDQNILVVDERGRTKKQKGRLSIVGMLPALASPSTHMTISPFHSGLASHTTMNGTLQIVDIERSKIRREYSVWQHKEKVTPVYGTVWLDEFRLLLFGFDKQEIKRGEIRYQNRVSILNSTSGEIKDIRPSPPDTTYIKTVKLSYGRQYFFILFKDGRIEVWNAVTFSVIKTLKAESQIGCAEWLPNKESKETLRGEKKLTPTSSFDDEEHRVLEQFLVALNLEGAALDLVTRNNSSPFRCFSVSGDSVVPVQVSLEAGQTQITCMAIKDVIIACGDSSGIIRYWNTTTNELKGFPTHHGALTQIQFSPSGTSLLLLALSNSGTFGIWDLSQGVRVSVSSNLTGSEIGWTGGFPTVLTSDYSLRVLDKALSSCNSRVQIEFLEQPLASVYIMPPQRALLVHTMLAHLCVPFSFNTACSPYSLTEETLVELEKSDLLNRCLITARYFEGLHELRFWTLASICCKKCSDARKRNTTESKQQPLAALEAPKSVPCLQEAPLEGFFELLSDATTLSDRENERAILHSKRLGKDANEESYKSLANFDLLLGRREEAIELLLSTIGSKELNMQMVLKACIVAASIGRGSFERTVQLVASTLISRGNVVDGIELLCVIDRAADACKYLQTTSRWTDAAWLATLRLDGNDSAQVLRAWASFLASSGQLTKAMEVLLCLHEFHLVLHLLATLKSWETAALFARCCTEMNVLVPTSSDFFAPGGVTPLSELLKTVYNSYAQYLTSVAGLETASTWYTKCADMSAQSTPPQPVPQQTST